MDRAVEIMEEMRDDLHAGKVRRKDVIEGFVDEAGLTKAGSSTYYDNINKEADDNRSWPKVLRGGAVK